MKNKKQKGICEAEDCNNKVKNGNALYCSKECRLFSNGRYVGESREEYNNRKKML